MKQEYKTIVKKNRWPRVDGESEADGATHH